MKKGTVLIVIGLLLIAVALGIVGYNMWDSHRVEVIRGEVLQQLIPAINDEPVAVPDETEILTRPEEVEYPDYMIDPNMAMPIKEIDGYEYIGVLKIPSLGLELPVMSDWSYPKLKIAPCRYTGSVYLDDMIIAAHNYDRHFGQIKNLRLGDEVIFTDMDGNEFVYSVLEVETLRPTAVEEMESGDWDLTLFTCTIGGQSRVTVRCEKCVD